MDRPHVLVVSIKTWAGLARMPSLLHRAGCRVSVLAPWGSPITLSRFICNRHRAPRELPQFIQALRDLLARRRFDWVILGDEPTLFAVAAHRGEEWLNGWFPVDPAGRGIELLESKNAFVEACLECGVPVPPSQVCRNIEQAKFAAQRIGFPVMLKGDSGSSGTRVRQAEHVGQVSDYYNAVAGGQPVLVQKYIDALVGSTQILFDHGRPICYFAAYKTQCWPAPFGPSCARRYVYHPSMKTILDRIGSMAGYHGLCGLDWIHNPQDNALYVLELNARPTNHYHLGHGAGVNFSTAIGQLLACEPADQSPAPDPSVETIYLFPEHILRCLEDGDWRELKRWFGGSGIFDVPWNEPLLLARQLLRIGQQLMQHIPFERRNHKTVALPVPPAVIPSPVATASFQPHRNS